MSANNLHNSANKNSFNYKVLLLISVSFLNNNNNIINKKKRNRKSICNDTFFSLLIYLEKYRINPKSLIILFRLLFKKARLSKTILIIQIFVHFNAFFVVVVVVLLNNNLYKVTEHVYLIRKNIS